MSKYGESNIINRRFGRLIATGIHQDGFPSTRKWLCLCDCGATVAVAACSLLSGVTQSCGCRHREIVTSHGYSKSNRTYNSWVSMKVRCYNPKAKHFSYYGGSGVTVCQRWLESFENFIADMGHRPLGKTLDRINGSKLYSKETCKWSTTREQQENRSITLYTQYGGSKVTLKRASELSGISYITLKSRYRRGLKGLALFYTGNLRVSHP